MHDKIADEFGKDLELILGPKNRRTPITSLSRKEIEARLKTVPEFISHTGKKSLIDVAIMVLREIMNSRAFDGIDLNLVEKLPDWGVKEYSIDRFTLNYRAQRGTDVRRIARIILEFNANSCHPGVARITSDGEIFYNNGQHRGIGAICCGVLSLPVAARLDDSEKADFDQYIAENCDNLPSEDYDNFRNHVSRAEYYVEAGDDILYTDQEDYDIAQILKKHGCKPVSKKDKKGQKESGAIHRFDQVYKFWRTFGPEIFEKSLVLLRSTYSEQPALSEPHWGLCWLFKLNPEISKGDQNLISKALITKWHKAGNIWKDIKKQIERQFGEISWQASDNTDNGLKIASGMYSAIKKQFEEVEIDPPKDKEGRTIDVDIPIM